MWHIVLLFNSFLDTTTFNNEKALIHCPRWSRMAMPGRQDCDREAVWWKSVKLLWQLWPTSRWSTYYGPRWLCVLLSYHHMTMPLHAGRSKRKISWLLYFFVCELDCLYTSDVSDMYVNTVTLSLQGLLRALSDACVGIQGQQQR